MKVGITHAEAHGESKGACLKSPNLKKKRKKEGYKSTKLSSNLARSKRKITHFVGANLRAWSRFTGLAKGEEFY